MSPVRHLAGVIVGAAAATAFLVYCGGVPAGSADAGGSCECPAPVVKSGTRLRARVLRGEDGASQFLGWYDSKLERNCSQAGGGVYKDRCLPAVANRWNFGNEAKPYFADSACSVPGVLIVRSDGATIPVFCGLKDGAHHIGDAAPALYTVDAGGACAQAHDSGTDQEGAVFRRCDGPLVEPTELATLAETID
jgi:hypothetical protein